MEEVELSTLQLNTDRVGDRNSISVVIYIYWMRKQQFAHPIIYKQFAHPIIYKHLCALFSLIMIHGHVPSKFKIGILSPVVKDYRKSLLNVDNYRPVTINSVLSKIFEMCIFRRIHGLLKLNG